LRDYIFSSGKVNKNEAKLEVSLKISFFIGRTTKRGGLEPPGPLRIIFCSSKEKYEPLMGIPPTKGVRPFFFVSSLLVKIKKKNYDLTKKAIK